MALPAQAAFNNATPRGTFAGTHNYTITGGTLRRYSNTQDACTLVTNGRSTAAVSGIPAGSTIAAAYLYWGGSGTGNDWVVGFNAGNTLTSTSNITAAAGNRFTETYTTKSFFGGFYDVTSMVTGNGNYTFGGLTVDTGGDYCSGQNVLAAWALVVVYRNSSERYRYTRVYDGLALFRGSSVTTTQSGFRVPDLVDGKVSVVTWEGDPDTNSSFPLDGYTEELKFDGYSLSNSWCDGADNIYNSTIGAPPASCNSTTYGVDIDTFDVTPYLFEGQTGATLDYSSGNDAVFLSTQVISTTNTPVADLSITKTSNDAYFSTGQNGSFKIAVKNLGPEIATGNAMVTDSLAPGLTFVSGTGTGWSCSAVGQDVTCNSSQNTIAIGASLPDLTLTVAVNGSVGGSVSNTANVVHPMFDGTGGNNSSTVSVPVRRSSLASSTKAVVDQNGGSLQPGDVLRYTITLIENNPQGVAAPGVSVVDDLPPNVGNLSMVSIPSGAIDNSIGTGGANGTGQVNVTNINVPAASSTQKIVFDVTVSADAGPDDNVVNAATITNPNGTGATPSVTSASIPDPAQGAQSGNKQLYLLTGALGGSLGLTRTRPTTNGNMVWRSNDGQYQYFFLPALASNLSLSSTSATVTFRARRSGTNTNNRRLSARIFRNRTLAQLTANPNSTAGLISNDTGTVNFNNDTTYINKTTSAMTLTTTSLAANDILVVRVRNQDNNYVDLTQFDGVDRSYLTLAAQNVINVDSVGIYDSPCAGSAKSTWNAGDTVYVRASISDPFGGYDVSSTDSTLTLTDPASNSYTVTGATTACTSPVAGDGNASRILAFAYTLPASPSYGTWTAKVTGWEGSEHAISHYNASTFVVQPKALNVVKSHTGNFSAGGNNVYTLTVNNTGASVITGTTTVKDTLPAGLSFVSGTGTGWSCSAAGQVVTCTSTASAPANGSMAPITLTVLVASYMGSSVDNQASVGNSTIGGGVQKPGNIDKATILHPNLSTSTKSVIDTNGGDANPGDTLRYTITLKETAGVAASNITVTDALQSGQQGLTGLNTSLSTCTGTTAVAGSNLTVSGISLAASGTCTLVFDVTISASAGAGFTIDNTATVNNPNGPGATPSSPTVTVSQSQQAITGNKILYVYTAPAAMTRTPQGASAATATVNENGSTDFALGAVQAPLVLSASSTINISLLLQRTGGTASTSRSVYVQLFKNGAAQIGANSNTVTFTSNAVAAQPFTITVPASGNAASLQVGDTLTLRVVNATAPVSGTYSVGVQQYSSPTVRSTVSFSTSTVIHVDSVDAYSAAYPSTTQSGSYGQGSVVYLRAVVSDPFGYNDINGAAITVKDAAGATKLNAAPMTSVAASGALRTYEYAYTVPASPGVGGWTAAVTAKEGTENTVSHTGNGGFVIGGGVKLRKIWGAGATAGDRVTLAITGGTGATAGSSTAPSTLTQATSNATVGATITLTEAFTVGAAADYTVTLACTKDSDGTAVTVSGSGLSRTITMPPGGATCSFTNSKTVPLTVVKLVTTVSDPVNGTTNPKAIPGAIVEYQIIVANPAANPVDNNTVFITDQVPANMQLRAADIGVSGSGPAQYIDGSPASGMTYTFASLSSAVDDIAFSSDGGATWTYTPAIDGNGTDPAVTNVRINPKGAFNGNNAQFTIKLRMRVE